MSEKILLLAQRFFSTIRVRLLLIFLLFTFILSVVTFTFYKIHKEGEIDSRLKDVIHSLSSRILLLNNYELQFVQNDLKNNKFFQTGQSYNISMHKEMMKGILHDLNAIDLTKISDAGTREKFNQLRNDLHNYNDTYTLYLKKIKERGFRDYGLEGTMRKYIQDAERYKYPMDMMTLLLMIRRNEKDYILRKDTSYIPLHSNNVNVLINKIDSDPSMSDSLKKEMEFLINNYRFYFNKWIVVDREIGIDQGIGLSEQLKKYNVGFRDTIRKIIDEVNVETIKLGHINQIVLFTTISISIMLSILLSIF